MAEKVKLFFLGTSGMIPEIDRNHPAFFISYANEGILIDCGEGTQTQFRKVGLSLSKITKILITHWHGDHTLGLPGLLKTLSMSDYKKKLFIYGPRGIKKRIDEMFKAFGYITEFPIEVVEASKKFFENKEFYLESEEMTHGVPCNSYSFVLKGQIRIDKKKITNLKLRDIELLKKLKQGKDISFEGKKYSAKKLTFPEKEKKISFVLDTNMNKKIVPFVKNSNALVCESSFSNSLRDKAEEYKHLTSTQAGEIANKSRSKSLYLVHLSSRHSKNTKQILDEAKKKFKNSFIPKDLDSVEI